MKVSDALAAIAGGRTADDLESRTLEFKGEGRSKQDTVKALAEAAACFANAHGGELVVGVRDRVRGSAAFEGTELDPEIVLRRIYELTNPSLTVSVSVRLHEGIRLLVIAVPRSADVHQVDNRITRRVGKICEPMTASQIAGLLAERRGEDWSAEDSGRALEDVNSAALDRARALVRASPDPARRRYAGESDRDLLRILGVVTSAGTLTRAGELLLCDPPSSRPLIVYQYRRTAAGEPVVSRPEGPLLLALLRTLELVAARLDTTPVNLPGGVQVQLADLPEAAVREAIANAAIHRDYRLGGSVAVEHAPTRLAITSPGPLVQGVTVDNILTTSSRPRNPQLANAVRVLGLAEEAGVGVDRMYREMVSVGHEPPIFEESSAEVRVSLLGGAPNTHLARFVATLPAAEKDDADAMMILYTLLKKRTVSAKTLAGPLQKSETEVEAALRRVSAEPAAMLEPTRETLRNIHPNYRLREHAISALGPAVMYRRRTSDEYDRKIVQLVAEVGTINARLVKIALDLQAASVSRVLSDLVERQILSKTSDATRGPSVTYGPGLRFPKAERVRKGKRDASAGKLPRPDALS